MEEGNKYAKLGWVSQVIGGHGLERVWTKLIICLDMGISGRGQRDGTGSQKYNPQANESWRMGVLNPCLEQAKWVRVGQDLASLQCNRGMA